MYKVSYLLSGLSGRLGSRRECVVCGSLDGKRIDRKWFHSLIECQNCGVLFRFPSESPEKMAQFYAQGYSEPGLTTQLPDDDALSNLLERGFKGSEKDFTYHTAVLKAVGAPENGRLLDYGANWGYASWQFARSGFDVTSYEISKERANFGKKLGIDIHTDIATVGDGFDVVYSSHVMEHTPNPKESIDEQLALVRPGGLVVAHTPNGSAAHREAAVKSFNRLWGLAHPVLLTKEFVQHVAGPRPYLITSDDRPEMVSQWDGQSQMVGDLSGGGLFFAIRAA